MTNQLPEHIREAFLKTCKSVVLDNYVGNRRRINEDWQKSGHRVYLFSYSVSNSSYKGLRELRQLVAAGFLTEDEKAYKQQMCRFRLVDKELEQELLRQAYDYWCSFGYNTHDIKDKRH